MGNKKWKEFKHDGFWLEHLGVANVIYCKGEDWEKEAVAGRRP